MKTESESIEAIMRSRWVLFEGFVAHIENTKLSKRRNTGGRGVRRRGR